jgi:uncharacterized protein YbjT (DUF2867 family)
MHVVVIGATGGSGRAAVRALQTHGHEVTAFARRASVLPGVRTVDGDVTVPDDVDRAVRGQDAVVVTLGISESPLQVRLRGSSGTPGDVRSRGTAELVRAMRERGVPRLVVQSSYGVGPTRDRLPLSSRLVFAALLRPQIADHERQEEHVRASELAWTIVQPVHLTDGTEEATCSPTGDVEGWRVSRSAVGEVLAGVAADPGMAGTTLAVSGAGSRRGRG